MSLSAEAIIEYNESPYHCPYCGSEDIDAGEWDWDNEHTCQEVRCRKCEQVWCDVYQFVGIEEKGG